MAFLPHYFRHDRRKSSRPRSRGGKVGLLISVQEVDPMRERARLSVVQIASGVERNRNVVIDVPGDRRPQSRCRRPRPSRYPLKLSSTAQGRESSRAAPGQKPRSMPMIEYARQDGSLQQKNGGILRSSYDKVWHGGNTRSRAGFYFPAGNFAAAWIREHEALKIHRN